MSQSIKPRYRTTNEKQYNAALKVRDSLTVWLDKRMAWFAAASGKRGRSPKFSDAAIQFCLTIKNLFGLALRQSMGFIESFCICQDCIGQCSTSALSAAVNIVCKFMCRIALARQGCIDSWTPRASSSWVKASGNAKNTALSAEVSSASCISTLTLKRCKYARFA